MTKMLPLQLQAYSQHLTLNRLFGCLFSWYDVITCKSKQIIGCTLTDALILKLSYFLMFLNIQIDLTILKTDDEQFILTTKTRAQQ